MVQRDKVQDKDKNTLKVACWNCGGNNLQGRMNEIKALASINKLDIFGVVECCLKAEDDKTLVEMEGYDLLVEGGISVRRRSAARVVVFIRSSLAYQQLKVLNHEFKHISPYRLGQGRGGRSGVENGGSIGCLQ